MSETQRTNIISLQGCVFTSHNSTACQVVPSKEEGEGCEMNGLSY